MWALALEPEQVMSLRSVISNGSSQEQFLAISNQAVSVLEGNFTIRLWGSVHCQQVLILVDYGSSSTFIGSHMLALMPGVQKLQRPLQVKIADGGILACHYEIPSSEWLCQGYIFTTSMKVLPLSGYDMVLGMDWLEMFSPMEVNWKDKWISFQANGKLVKLQGILPNTACSQLITLDQLDGLIKSEAVEHLLELRVMDHGNYKCTYPPKTKELIAQFVDLFVEPSIGCHRKAAMTMLSYY
jgi:hypothetical protein